MEPTERLLSGRRGGFALIVSMIFVLLFTALALSVATFSSASVVVADNHRQADRARAVAESGLEIVRLWLSKISISGNTPPAERFPQIAALLLDYLAANHTNVTAYYDTDTVYIRPVQLDADNEQRFAAQIRQSGAETIDVVVTGQYRQFSKQIAVKYIFGTRADTVFDFGVATKGPLSLAGNIELEGVKVSVDASVYIESESSSLALSITGNSQIAGDVSIVNPIATVELVGGKAGIGGETGDAAIENHVEFGVPPSEFPEPSPGLFEGYATNIVDCNTYTSSDATFENIRILAGTNPVFSGHTTLKGVVFIESPNVVTFAGGADVTAVIVGDGDLSDDSGTNRIIFEGNVSSRPVSELPDEPQFEGIREATGTFIVAPGFALSFGGSFDTICGAIAGNGVEFYGRAGGTINGSVINYSEEEMTLTGNSDLYFNRSGLTEAPAGFVPEIILKYDPASYTES